MAEHMFGLGKGWLPARASQIARRHDAEMVNYTDASCTCGHGCVVHECPMSRRHWFATANMGEPFNTATASAVMAELRLAGIVEE